MSYQVIARKWRPKSFADVVGQSHISQTLTNALRNNRLPHALLFTGPRGTGKTSSARILAMSLRCPEAKDFVPCGQCSECLDISNGRSIDVIEVDGASNNGVDAIRELRDTVSYMPSSGRYKVYIIDEVHMLSTSAFNALLKTLEEPPEHVIFVMATTEVHKIPNTILSRCQRFDFRRISIRSIAEHLKTICESENITADEEALWMVARQGDGSMRDSQSLLDQVITFSEGAITLQKVVDVLGLTDRQLLIKTIQGLVDRDVTSVVAVIQDIFAAGYDPKIYMQDLLEELRHLLMVKIAPEQSAQLIDLSEAEIERLKELSAELSNEDVHLLFDMALKGANDIPRSQEPRVVLEMLLLRMAEAPRIASLKNLVVNPAPPVNTSSPSTASVTLTKSATTSTVKTNTGPTAPREAVTPPAMPEDASPPAISDVASTPQGPAQPQEEWLHLVKQIKNTNGIIGAKLEHAYFVGYEKQKLTIGIPPKMKFIFEQLNEKENLLKLRNYLSTFWGPGHSVEVQLGREEEKQFTPNAIAQRQEEERQQEVRRQVESHPFVKSVQSIFKSEIQAIKELS
ncbi:MAG: DNA polymerase III subunit gamma/tau [Pseudobdellovibrionaceae bacterium]|nr:DNA polymerase III subunit gamma/tau [Bdellovibrionales bacterium]USN47029.1 MAG: DNA polymerase III subunit gamma/tau [Pseudobdellovibrionaceae bacterium]